MTRRVARRAGNLWQVDAPTFDVGPASNIGTPALNVAPSHSLSAHEMANFPKSLTIAHSRRAATTDVSVSKSHNCAGSSRPRRQPVVSMPGVSCFKFFRNQRLRRNHLVLVAGGE